MVDVLKIASAAVGPIVEVTGTGCSEARGNRANDWAVQHVENAMFLGIAKATSPYLHP